MLVEMDPIAVLGLHVLGHLAPPSISQVNTWQKAKGQIENSMQKRRTKK
jgi:hypothetical protein